MPDPTVNGYGPFAIFQFAGAFLVLAALALALFRGSRDRPRNSSVPLNEQLYFFDGPVGEALKLLRDNRNISNEIKENVEPLGEQARKTNDLLHEIKDKLDDIRTAKLRR